MTATVQFVGRATELDVLGTELAEAMSGRPRIAWIEGESGIGKTQLLRRFIERAPGTIVIDASSEQGESALPFGVTDQLWTRLRVVRPDGPRARFQGPHESIDPLAMGAELLDAVGSIDGPVILAIDDLQWIDLPSARALLLLLRRLSAEPLLVVLISQPDPAARLGQGWARLLGDRDRVTRIGLAGVTTDDLIDLARGMGQSGLGRHQAARLHRFTQGHPLYARAMLDEYGVSGLRASQPVLPPPRSLTSLVSAKVASLSTAAHDLVAAGAVFGSIFSIELAAMIGQVDDPVDALEAAMAVGLVDRRLDGQIEFSHPLVQSAVYTDLTPTRRRSLHSAAASITAGALSLTHRIGAASGSDAELAAELAALAASEAESGRYALAVDHLDAAARLAADPATRERLLLESVTVMHEGGDLARAAAMTPVVEECADGPQRTFVLALSAYADGRITEAERMLSHVIADRDDESAPPTRVTQAAATLGLARLQQLDWQGALDAAEVALDGDLTWDGSMALFTVVDSLDHLDRLDEAFGRLADAASRLPDGQPGSLDILAARGQAKLRADDLAGAVGDLSAVATRARNGEPIRMHEFALCNLAEAYYFLGRWDDALLNAELAASLAADSGRRPSQAHAHAVAATVLASRGQYDAAGRDIEVAEIVAGQTDAVDVRILVAIANTTLARVRDGPAAMRATIGGPFRGRVNARLANTGPPSFRILVIEALLGGGELDEATVAIDSFDRLVTDRGLESFRVDAARFQGLLAEATGDTSTAVTFYERGLEASPDRLTGTLGHARLAASLGGLLSRLDRRRPAIEHLRAARDTFIDLGAEPFVSECDDELSRCGLPTPTDSARGPLELTDAEVRVARLVADGLTNRETASRLYVSPKTVEYHLGNVFTKLGINSRSVLADRLRHPG